MHTYFVDFLHNSIFLTVALAWFIAQATKVVIGVIQEKRFNFKWFFCPGGMPSSHASSVSALATSVGFCIGFDSILFAITLIFSLIVMFDAQGVRRATGEQAELLNKIVDDIYWKRGIEENKLRELLGHTPIEVIAGAIIGILVGIILGT